MVTYRLMSLITWSLHALFYVIDVHTCSDCPIYLIVKTRLNEILKKTYKYIYILVYHVFLWIVQRTYFTLPSRIVHKRILHFGRMINFSAQNLQVGAYRITFYSLIFPANLITMVLCITFLEYTVLFYYICFTKFIAHWKIYTGRTNDVYRITSTGLGRVKNTISSRLMPFHFLKFYMEFSWFILLNYWSNVLLNTYGVKHREIMSLVMHFSYQGKTVVPLV